jgi:hypothetical protein
MVQKYDGRYDDGKWHKITLPIADLSRGEGPQFDWENVWEFQLSKWDATPRDFSIYIDQIAAQVTRSRPESGSGQAEAGRASLHPGP